MLARASKFLKTLTRVYWNQTNLPLSCPHANDSSWIFDEFPRWIISLVPIHTNTISQTTSFSNLFIPSQQDNGRSVPDLTASPGRPAPGPMQSNQHNSNMQMQRQGNAGGLKEPVLIQGDFRKVSGISSEIFRQIETVENDHDPSTAAALDVSLKFWICFCRDNYLRCAYEQSSHLSSHHYMNM